MPPDDHENRLTRLEICMEMVSEQQHRADEERREQYSEIIRELKALRAETNRQQEAERDREEMAGMSITSRQGEQQLILAGLDEQVEAAIEGIEDVTQRKMTRAWYHRASTWDRDNASLAALADALGLTDAQVDDLFRAAAEL